MEHYRSIRNIGKGSYGVVELVCFLSHWASVAQSSGRRYSRPLLQLRLVAMW
jgi:hypothetical protein